MKKEDLLKMIEEDELGLLVVKPKASSVITSDERLVSSFQEINSFIRENGKEPEAGKGIQEHQLATRLKSIREDKKKSEDLAHLDEHNLLGIEQKEITSISDIFDDDSLGLLNSTDDDIFKIKNIRKIDSKERPDFISRRKPYKDFDKYENLFAECQNNLKGGKLKLKKLEKHKQLHDGSFFVLGGVLGFIEKTEQLKNDSKRRLNGRLHIIFENGTESDMLLQSLRKSLQDNDGWLVSENKQAIEYLIPEKDTHTGFIYILKSLNENPKIQSYANLYKIGYSTIPVEERIKNAQEDPTFLMGPVKIIETFECYNFNPQKLEQLLHNFFGSACLNLDVFDLDSKRYSPREWFIAPLSVIERAIELIIDGGIINFKYDSEKEMIVLK